jgi:hypothetical protein
MSGSTNQVIPAISALPITGYKARVLKELGLSANPLPHIESDAPILAELIRTFVWALWKPRRTVNGSIHDEIGADFAELKSSTIQLLRAMGWLAKTAAADYDNILNLMRQIGDIERITDARFAPTPLRFIDAGSSHYFISGGQPTRLMPPVISNSVAHVGVGRWLTGTWTPETLRTLGTVQSLSDWLRRPHRSLPEHFGLMFDLPRRRVVAEADAQDVLAYVPDLCLSQEARFSQSQRWKPLSDVHGTRTALISFRTSRPGTQYAIGELENGRVTAISEPFRASLNRGRTDDVRRLQFAIDRQLNRPLHIEQISPTSISLGCSLPAPETRLLLFSANKMASMSGRDYPQRWQFIDESALQLWRTTVSALGTRVVPAS